MFKKEQRVSSASLRDVFYGISLLIFTIAVIMPIATLMSVEFVNISEADQNIIKYGQTAFIWFSVIILLISEKMAR